MRHRNAGFKLGRNTSHRRALLRNLVTSVIVEDRVETTVAKAKAVRPHVEKMITLGKKGDVHSRRQALSFLMTDAAVDAPVRYRGPALRRSPGRLSAHRPHRFPEGRWRREGLHRTARRREAARREAPEARRSRKPRSAKSSRSSLKSRTLRQATTTARTKSRKKTAFWKSKAHSC